MKRPSFQFYPDDWQSNSNLKRCTFAEKGIWMDVMCLMHDQEEEYGLLRWPLKEIAEAVKCKVSEIQGLVRKGVLKGADANVPEFIYVPRSARKDGEPVTLIPAQNGPLWYCSRMVKDEHVRIIRGESSRFSANNGATPKAAPDSSPKTSPKPPLSDGSSSSSSSSSSASPREDPPIPPRDRGVSSGRDRKVFDPNSIPALDMPSWQRWVQYRAERKPALKPASLEAAAQELAKFGEHQADVVQHSIANGYQGLFAPKSNGNGAHASQSPTRYRTADELEDELIVAALRKGLTDEQIAAMEDLATAPNLLARIRTQREELQHEQH